MHFTGGNRTGKERQDGQAVRRDRQSVRPRENTNHDDDDGHREETVRVDMTDRDGQDSQADRHDRQSDSERTRDMTMMMDTERRQSEWT